MTRAEDAVQYFQQGFSCSQAVAAKLCPRFIADAVLILEQIL
jgi:hypothetical protein